LKASNWSGSIYTQADWKLDEQWSLTAGLRYTRESRKLTRIVDDANVANYTNDGSAVIISPLLGSSIPIWPNGPGSFNPSPGYIHNTLGSTDGSIADINNQSDTIYNSAWTPMMSVQRTFQDVGFIETGSTYFTISRGFLSGGIGEALDPFTQRMPEYKPEKVTNYEIGFKFDAFDRRVRLNTALFYLDYQDRQLTSIVADPQTARVAGIPINAAKSNIKGIEIESQFIPMDDLELTLNLTFNRGEIDKFEDNRIVVPGSLPNASCQQIRSASLNVDSCKVDRSGENLPRLPEAIYFVAAQYTIHSEIGEFIPRVQWSYRTHVDNCFDVASCNSGAYLTNQQAVGARVTWVSKDSKWGASAYVSNLTDQRYITGGTPLVDVTETAGTVYNEPRMYGLETHYSW
jgi:iron complex outermembrane receptor protein